MFLYKEMSYLPNRQLRKIEANLNVEIVSYLPNRQLRKDQDKCLCTSSSYLPNRQLRNVEHGRALLPAK